MHDLIDLNHIVFIKSKWMPVEATYRGDGLEITYGEIAMVSKSKAYQLETDFPGKFELLTRESLSANILRTIYNERKRLIHIDLRETISESELYDLLVDSPSNLLSGSQDNVQTRFEKEHSPNWFEQSIRSVKNHPIISIGVFILTILAGLIALIADLTSILEWLNN